MRSSKTSSESKSSSPIILVTEDDRNMRTLITTVLQESVRDFEIVAVENGHEAMDFLDGNQVAVVVTDLRMPGADGMDLLGFVRQRSPLAQVVMVTGHATVESAIKALKLGAFDYILKPFDTEELRCIVEKALDHHLLVTENRRLKCRQSLYDDSGELIGQSAGIEHVNRLINAVASHDCGVFIYGESGSGKELVARQIHLRSKRSDKRFVAINCAAIPDSLIESELFGHKKGAFTGAERDKFGLFEAADGGTLFLDEINSASLALQSKLIRVLQDGSYYPMGSTSPMTVDVLVLAATNRPIRELVDKGEFREDLYYRLTIMEINVPALRERPEDVTLLAYFFLHKHSTRLHKPIKEITTDALGRLLRHDWPGNVRELENVIQRMIILTEGDKLDSDSLPDTLAETPERVGSALDHLPPKSLDEMEAYFIRKTLRETAGDRGLAAEILGIDKSTLWRKIKRYQIE